MTGEKGQATKEKTQMIEEGVDCQVCPFHCEMIVNIKNGKGYQLMKCSEQPCLISIFDENNKQAYMEGATTKYIKIFKMSGINCSVTVVIFLVYAKVVPRRTQDGCT